MSQPHLLEPVQAIHSSNLQLSLSATGGGSLLLGELLTIPGASNTVLDARIPYSTQALDEFLQGKPAQYCSRETAASLAVASYLQTQKFSGNSSEKNQKLIGIGITASLATNRPKKGSHRFFVGLQGDDFSRVVAVELEKNKRTRLEEERLIVEIGISEILKLIEHPYDVSSFSTDDHYSVESVQAPGDWVELFQRRKPFVNAVHPDQKPATGIGILAGSFNPLHSGHQGMAKLAREKLGCEIHFELAIRNADKPPLDYLTLEKRAEQFGDNLWLTNAATFQEKSNLFPNSTFLVGIDTIARIAERRFYPGPNGLEKAIQRLTDNQTKFLIFGRFDQGEFKTLDSIELPDSLRRLCIEVTETEYRKDISSTEIRSKNLAEKT